MPLRVRLLRGNHRNRVPARSEVFGQASEVVAEELSEHRGDLRRKASAQLRVMRALVFRERVVELAAEPVEGDRNDGSNRVADELGGFHAAPTHRVVGVSRGAEAHVADAGSRVRGRRVRAEMRLGPVLGSGRQRRSFVPDARQPSVSCSAVLSTGSIASSTSSTERTTRAPGRRAYCCAHSSWVTRVSQRKSRFPCLSACVA